MCREVIIHIGLHKTGTTSIQGFAADHRQELAEAGICYPVAGSFPWYPAHHGIAWQARGDVRFDPAYGGIEEAIRELLESPAPVGLISSEDFSWLAGAPLTLRSFRDRLRAAGLRIR